MPLGYGTGLALDMSVAWPVKGDENKGKKENEKNLQTCWAGFLALCGEPIQSSFSRHGLPGAGQPSGRKSDRMEREICSPFRMPLLLAWLLGWTRLTKRLRLSFQSQKVGICSWDTTPSPHWLARALEMHRDEAKAAASAARGLSRPIPDTT